MAPPVFHRRLVAVMAVGDDHLRRRHQRLHPLDRRRVGDAPQAVQLAAEVTRLGDRRAAAGRRLAQQPLGIRGQHEEEADVGPGRLEMPHAVLLGAGVRALVRQHDAARVVGHLAQRDEAGARHLGAAGAVGLRVGIDRRPLLARPHPIGEPALEDVAGRLIPIAPPFLSREGDADDVLGAHRVEAVLQLGRDLVVGRRRHGSDVTLLADAIPISAEGLDPHPLLLPSIISSAV